MPRLPNALFRSLGAAIAIAVMEALAQLAGEPMFRVPFVTSIVLAMALPDSEPSQPRCIIGGHLLCSIAGLATLGAMGQGDMASAVAVGAATLLMIASRTLHPPAGIDAFLVASYGLSPHWVINPVLSGALLLTGFALVWRKLERLLLQSPPRRAPDLGHGDTAPGSDVRPRGPTHP